MNAMEQVDEYLTQNADRFLDELKQFLRIPSVSADSAFQPHMTTAAEFVRDRMIDAGLNNVEIVPTAGNGIVYGERIEDPSLPTVVVYGHYDVQPPDPLDDWISPAFEPTERDGCIYARGATDDKGQMYTHIKSVEAWTKTVGRLPVNVKFVIEGEEEVGSNNLGPYLTSQREQLKCDVAVISDTSQYAPNIPAITYGLRGIVACEVTLNGPNQDLHSGVFGGSVANPANALARLIGQLHDDDGRVQIPGFYDGIVELTESERASFAELPFSEADYLSKLGMDQPFGESGFSTLERRWARPTCDVNGMLSGYTGEGPKTIVPSKAMAKITCRLAPGQDADAIVKSLEAFVRTNCRPGLSVDFKSDHGAPGLVFDTSSPYMTAASQAIEQSFGRAPVMIREGGSIPVVTTFRDVLGVDTLLLGWGQNTDNLHSPNEHFSIEDFHRGTRASAWLWKFLAE